MRTWIAAKASYAVSRGRRRGVGRERSLGLRIYGARRAGQFSSRQAATATAAKSSVQLSSVGRRFFIEISSTRRSKMVNKDQVAGVAKQAKGAVKDAAGKVTGSRETQAEGKADKAAGKVQKAYGDARESVKKAI